MRRSAFFNFFFFLIFFLNFLAFFPSLVIFFLFVFLSSFPSSLCLFSSDAHLTVGQNPNGRVRIQAVCGISSEIRKLRTVCWPGS